MKKSVFNRFHKLQKMDKVSDDDIGEQTGSEFTSPSPPKQPRRDYMVMDDQCDFPVLLTFPKTISSTSALSPLQRREELMCAAERGGFQDENSHEQVHGGKLNVTLVTEVTTSHCRIAHSGSPDEGFITAGGQWLALSRDGHRLVTESRESGAGGRSAPAGADTGDQLGEPLEEETPPDCSLSSGNEGDERQVQITAISWSAQSEEVTRRPDCTQGETRSSVSSEDAGTDQKRDEFETSDTIPSEEEGKRLKPLRDHADYTKFFPNRQEETGEDSAPAGKHAKTEFEIRVKESVSVCNLETKGQVNETDGREAVLLSAAECAEGSILACDVVSDRNTASEDACFEVDDFCGAKGASAAGEIIAEAPSEKADHTTETAMPARISQEPAERDNDAGPFGVIDPAIWSETDRQAEERGCNSESAAGGGLSPSVNTHKAEAPLPICPDVMASSPDRSGQFNHRSTTPQDEDEDFCRARSVIASKPHDAASNESGCRWEISSSPPESPPAPPAGDDGKQESHDAVGHELKEQSASSCFPGGPNHPQVEICHKTAEIKEHQESSVTAAKSNEPQSSEEAEILVEVAESFSADWTESETHEPESRFKLVEEEQGNKLGCLSDLQLMMDVAGEEKEGEEEMETGGHEDSQTLENCDVKREDEQTAQVAEGRPGESAERNQVINPEHDCQHTADIRQKLVAFTSCPGNDALVPCQRDFSLSQSVHHESSARSGNNRFSPLTSAFAPHSHALGGFDTFQKIQLSPSDDDDDDNIVGLDDWARVPVLTNSPHQMLQTPRLQLGDGEAEGEAGEDAGFVCSASSCDELPNFISGADVITVEPHGYPSDHQQHSDPPAASTGSDAPSSDISACSRFEMKTQFDTVLKELQLFFDISRNELAEHCGDITEPSEGNASERRRPGSPQERRHRDAPSDDVDEDHSLEIHGSDGEQEVPLSSHLCQETPEETRRERLETQQRGKTWSPSFGFEPLLEHLSHRLLEPPRRLEPLKTCTGPRRLGLSKRARVKPLHRPHPHKPTQS